MLINKSYGSEKGSILIVTIVVLLAVSILGVTMVTLSRNQIDMATNVKVKEVARFNCDSCTTTVTKLIRHIVDQSNEGVIGIAPGSALAPGIDYAAATTSMTPQQEFAQKVLFGLQAPGCEDVQLSPQAIADAVNAASDGQLIINPNEIDSAADIRSSVVTSAPGTAALEFAAGVGHGLGESGASGGGMVMKFVIACRGRGPYNALHVGYSVYRKNLHVGKGN
jgi:hypothetical protein